MQKLDTGGEGPEDVAIAADGRIHAGLLDGRIVRLAPDGSRPETFARTGGRPLGLRFSPSGRLLVADAHRGLLSVEPNGAVQVLATEAEGVPFRLTDDLDVAADGTVYFSDASSRFGLEDSIADIVEHRPSGRLLAYDPRTRTTRLLLGGLCFANGVALSPDESFVLVAETSAYRVRRYWLKDARAGASDVFIDNLPAFPDGVANGSRMFWLALVSPRDALLDRLHPHPALKRALMRLPEFLRPGPKRHAFVLGLDREGRVVHNFQDASGSFGLVSNAVEHEGSLYLGCLHGRSLGRFSLPPGRPPD